MGSRHRTKMDDWLSDDSLEIITGLARNGLTNEDIAKNIGIARNTLNNWCKKEPKIKEALKEGQKVADQRVENRLYQRAVGYKSKDVIKETDSEGKTHVKVIEKDVWPDLGAIIFWLKNRLPSKWRDRGNEEEEAARIAKILLENEEITARIAKVLLENEKLKEEIAQIKGEGEQPEDDGFVDALSASAAEDWAEESDEEA